MRQKVGDKYPSLVYCVCVLNILHKVSSLQNFFSYKPRESGDIDFLNSHVTSHWWLDQRVMFERIVHQMLHQKHESYRYLLPQKSWVNWITTRQEKMTQSQKYAFWEVPTNYNACFSMWLPCTTLLLKQKPVELKRSFSPFWKLEIPMMLLCMFGLFLKKKFKNTPCKKE